jgi:hypothetical protein
LDRGKKVLVEGTQGFGLSLYHSDSYPKATSRDTTAAAFLSEVGLSPLLVTEIVLVLRTFPIRVAGEQAGPMKDEITWEILQIESSYPHPIHEMTTVSNRLRRVGRFDWELAEKAVTMNRPTQLAINGLDYIDARNRGTQLGELTSVLLGTGPQVDPGFSGALSCPLYNLTNMDLTIRRGQDFATIDFEKTTTLLRGRSLEEMKTCIDGAKDKDLQKDSDETYSFYKTPPLHHQLQRVRSRGKTFVLDHQTRMHRPIAGESCGPDHDDWDHQTRTPQRHQATQIGRGYRRPVSQGVHLCLDATPIGFRRSHTRQCPLLLKFSLYSRRLAWLKPISSRG